MLRYEKDGPRATITLDDPERRNPLSAEAMEQMREALLDATTDPEIRVIVFTGAGDRVFSAGGDLSGGFFDDPIGLHETRGLISEVFRLMRRGGKPTIARVNGHALAGGFGLAAACDIVVSVADARMGTTEIKVGLWPMQISAVLQRLMPARQALELFMTGRVFTAAEAVDLGVVTRVVGTIEELDEAVNDYVETLVNAPATALAFGRDAFYRVQDMGFDDAVAYLQGALTAVTMTKDAKEGVTAFLERRDPDWQ